MAKHVFDDVTAVEVDQTNGNQTWTFTKASSVHVATGTALNVLGTSNNYTMLGALASDDGDAFKIIGANNHIEIGANANLTGDDAALWAIGGGLTVLNDGALEGSRAVKLRLTYGTDAKFTNDGAVTSDHTAILVGGVGSPKMELDNNGTIDANMAINVRGGFNTTITNHGHIIGDIGLHGARNVLDNRGGTIEGDIHLTASDAGGTVIDTRGGTIDGNIIVESHPYSSRNTLITDDADIHFSRAGNNTVKSSVSYKLNSHEHTLKLFGADDIDGTGSRGSDQLHGNSGDNVLNGKGGSDRFGGGAGDDKIICGGSNEYIVFSRGGDQDTIVNYEGSRAGERDIVDLRNFWNITDFAQAQSHMSQHGSDAWLDIGRGDLLIFQDFHFHNFRPSDFNFEFTN
jgi:hypothetical protein